MTRRLVRIIDSEREDTAERVEALRLQARAWRLLAIIAVARPEYARKLVRYLFFTTVPFVNGPAVSAFIEEHEAMAKTLGTEAGIFQDSETKESAGGEPA